MSELSGPQWCARFPGSAKTIDLLPDFRDRVEAFISVMKSASATVSVAATFRPPERAYLMHWCCMITDSGQDPAAVPPMAGVGIQWAHPTLAQSKAAAAAMKQTYQIKFPAALVSRHTQRRAIDMTIGWQGALTIHDFNGVTHHIASAPRGRIEFGTGRGGTYIWCDQTDHRPAALVRRRALGRKSRARRSCAALYFMA